MSNLDDQLFAAAGGDQEAKQHNAEVLARARYHLRMEVSRRDVLPLWAVASLIILSVLWWVDAASALGLLGAFAFIYMLAFASIIRPGEVGAHAWITRRTRPALIILMLVAGGSFMLISDYNGGDPMALMSTQYSVVSHAPDYLDTDVSRYALTTGEQCDAQCQHEGWADFYRRRAGEIPLILAMDGLAVLALVRWTMNRKAMYSALRQAEADLIHKINGG